MTVLHCMRAVQGTCALDAENVIRLLTFDAVSKDKAAGAALTQRTARLADLVKVASYRLPWTALCTEPRLCSYFVSRSTLLCSAVFANQDMHARRGMWLQALMMQNMGCGRALATHSCYNSAAASAALSYQHAHDGSRACIGLGACSGCM